MKGFNNQSFFWWWKPIVETKPFARHSYAKSNLEFIRKFFESRNILNGKQYVAPVHMGDFLPWVNFRVSCEWRLEFRNAQTKFSGIICQLSQTNAPVKWHIGEEDRGMRVNDFQEESALSATAWDNNDSGDVFGAVRPTPHWNGPKDIIPQKPCHDLRLN